jgi:ATP-dependent DNA helicase RecG
VKTSKLIRETLAENPTITLAELAERMKKSISAVERASSKLLKEGKLRYIGPQKGGYWQVVEGGHE